MVHLLLVAHAPLASALGEVAAHVFPGCSAHLDILDVPAHWSLEAAVEQVQRKLPVAEPVLVLVDVLGATPANAALRCAASRPDTLVVHGVNVPMLWRTLCYAHEPLANVAARAVEGATRGVGLAQAAG